MNLELTFTTYFPASTRVYREIQTNSTTGVLSDAYFLGQGKEPFRSRD